MLLYLTSNQKSNLIDPAVRNMTLPAKKLVGRFSLKSFVTKDMRNYANAKFFVVDAACIEESGNDFTLALQSFQMMFSARIIVILSGYEDVNGEVQRLLSIGVVNLVTGETMEDALDELTEALSEDGMQRYVVKAPVYEQPAMVDHADFLLAVYDNNRKLRSGTGQTVNYALKQNLRIIFLHPDTAEIS